MKCRDGHINIYLGIMLMLCYIMAKNNNNISSFSLEFIMHYEKFTKIVKKKFDFKVVTSLLMPR